MRKADLSHIFQYIGGIIRNLGGIPLEVGGVDNHIHILTSLPKTLPLSDFVRIIKANSSKWVKQLDNYYANFHWQTGYGAFSVSYTLLDRTINYIRRQEEHHKKQTFKDEYLQFLKHHRISYDEQYVFND